MINSCICSSAQFKGSSSGFNIEKREEEEVEENCSLI
jgi:hypothetical protein